MKNMLIVLIVFSFKSYAAEIQLGDVIPIDPSQYDSSCQVHYARVTGEGKNANGAWYELIRECPDAQELLYLDKKDE